MLCAQRGVFNSGQKTRTKMPTLLQLPPRLQNIMRFLLRFNDGNAVELDAAGLSNAIAAAASLPNCHCGYEIWLEGHRLYKTSRADSFLPRRDSAGRLIIDVIDNDDAVRESTCLLLDSCGFATRQHTCCEAFLDSLLAQSQCILIDHYMPQMGALDLLEHLHSQSRMSTAFLTTDHIDRMGRRRAHSMGVIVLLRPISGDQFVYRVARACRNGLLPRAAH